MQEPQTPTKSLKNDTFLTPKFFTTDFEKIANTDFSSHEEDLKAILGELRADYNRDRFNLQQDFDKIWQAFDEETYEPIEIQEDRELVY